MDGYFHSVRNIIEEGRTSSRIRFLLQDVVELRRNAWICRRREDGPKTIEQVHRQGNMERQRERSLVHQIYPQRDYGGQDPCVQVQPQPAWSCSSLQKEELPKEEKVRKPAVKRLSAAIRDPREETAGTQELYRSMHSVLDKLATEIFGHIMKQVNELHMNTEESLRGIAAIIFQKAISEPRLLTTCAKMCHCLSEINAPSAENPKDIVNFHLVLLKLCRMEIKKLDEDHEAEEKQHQQLVTNMKFIGELFKLRMMKETVIHNIITKLLITRSEVALECLCCLLSLIGSTLDCDEEHLMDGYIHQMEEIITTRQISSKISRLMQDIVALRKNYWFPLKPEPVCQVSMEAKLEEMQERFQEQQLVIEALSHDIQLQDEGQNIAIIPATLQACIFIQLNTLDFDTQLPIPRQGGTRWGHGMEEENVEINVADNRGPAGSASVFNQCQSTDSDQNTTQQQ